MNLRRVIKNLKVIFKKLTKEDLSKKPPVIKKKIKRKTVNRNPKPQPIQIQWPSTPEFSWEELCRLNSEVAKADLLKALSQSMEQNRKKALV